MESTPTDASSANSARSPEAIEVAIDWEDDGSPGQGKLPRVVISYFHDNLPSYYPSSRDAFLTLLHLRPTSSQAVSLPASSAQPSSSQPSTSTEGDLVPLNNEDVHKHPCLLTMSELEEVKFLLTQGGWIGIHLDSLKAPLTFPFSPFLFFSWKTTRSYPVRSGRTPIA